MRPKYAIYVLLLCLACTPAVLGQQSANSSNDNAELRQEVEQLKKTLSALEQKLETQEKKAEPSAPGAPAAATTAPNAATEPAPTTTDLQTQIKDLDERVQKTEVHHALDRINWTGDFRVESNSIFGHIPTYYDGMQLQNLLVKSMWAFMPTGQGGGGQTFNPALLGSVTPAQYSGMLQSLIIANPGSYPAFTNNLTFTQVKGFFNSFSPTLQGQFMSFLQGAPGVLVPGYAANDNLLATNRLRLNLDARVSDNVLVQARVSMYKVFGDSSGVQVFNGQPNTLNIDGTTATVPTGDMLRVERAFFTWNHIAGLPMYLSVGRRPSTDGPPMNFREDELRGGTPSGALINYQFDGLTLGYHVKDKTALRLCYGLGYDSGYGNGQVLEQPADRLKSVHFLGANIDAYETDKSLVQLTIARAWNVTDGFDGLVVLPNNPLTGDPINGGVVMRYSPSANLGAINLYGVTLTHRLHAFDLYTSMNMDSLRPNGVTTPFGGLGSNPFDIPSNHNGTMIYAGLRFNVPQNDGRTKIGFEFNHGSKYWFNFAQAEDDIFAPKTAARGDVYESYLTHRISDHFILKGDYQRFHYNWSGSGWDVGAPEQLSSTPVLGFPTYNRGYMLTAGLTARF